MPPPTATPSRTTATTLPPAGPAWYPAVMGTGILATLLQAHAGGSAALHGAALVVVAIAWAVLLGLTAAFATRVVTRPGTLRASVTDLATLPLWGTVAMGLLSVGAATAAVLPGSSAAELVDPVAVDAVLWVAGTALGLVTALGFAALLVRGHPGAPSPVWGLPVVPPMVSATTAAPLVAHLDGAGSRFLLVLLAWACFGLALVLGTLVFAVAYHHHWRVSPLEPAVAPSAWIPLGVVGQSTAAAVSLSAAGAGLLTPAVAAVAQQSAVAFGAVVLTVGAPLAGWALVVTLRGFASRPPFAPGWWALTFPVGTLSLGAHQLGLATGSGALQAVGAALLVVLCGTWTLCAVLSLRALAASLRRHRGPTQGFVDETPEPSRGLVDVSG
ncbi:TDT family transporter [Arthrobacter sp. NEB 688]|uniref:TDT family transporter n=1 Tax=Arthrobacter sp. NEB 688 TaxID=904039 RepID=UPI00156755F5|nr:TDT family transporter [Arthrobacter sp. NEB 688]QKE83422.1 TDT family transporter [Arthrobacter sp. NEB 688]